MDLDIYDYKTALDLDFTLTKAERLEVCPILSPSVLLPSFRS